MPYLEVSDGHRMYYETHGSVGAPPLIVLHGGPGGGMPLELLPLFSDWYTVWFDQRGCGKSRPFGDLCANTTHDLIRDIEALRTHLGLKQWTVYGGSWGTTLGLAYVLAHPDAVRAMIFRGTCLCDETSFRWLYERGGASELYPDAWAQFITGIPTRILGAGWRAVILWYHERIKKGGAEGRKAAEAWWRWEWSVSRLIPAKDTKGGAMAIALLETHYFLHGCWLPHLLGDLQQSRARLRRIPLTMVHGRYDLVCPLSGAETVRAALPHARLIIAQEAGHAAEDLLPTLQKEIRRMRLHVTRRRAKSHTVKRRSSQ